MSQSVPYEVLEGVLKVIFLLINFIRRTATLFVFLLMLAFLILSHTSGLLASMTTGAIRAATGLASASSTALATKRGLENELYEARIKSDEQVKAIEELERKNTRLTKDKKLATTKLTSLDAENRKLKGELQVSFRGKKMSTKAAAAQVTGSLQARTKRVAATNLASVAGESIPFYGIAIIAAATSYELKSACDTMRDLYDLDVALDPDGASDDGRDYVCGLQVPTKEEIWRTTKASPRAAWQTAVAAYDGSTDWVSNLEAPDFSGKWSSLKGWVSGWVD